MPKLPDSLGPINAPQPSASVATPQYGEPGEMEQARAMLQAGQQFAHTGNQLQAAFEEEKKRVDKARVEDAFNELRNSQLDLTVGQENGFMNIKGGAAVKQPLLKDYSSRLAVSAKLISDKLDNDEQKQLFHSHAATAQAQFTGDLLKHVYQQNEVYQKEIFEGTVKSEENIASTHWDTPPVVQASLVRIGAAVDAQADRMGLGREGQDKVIRDEMFKEQASKVHAAVLNQAIANKQYVYAEDYFKQFQGELNDTTRKSAAHALMDAGQKQVFDGFQSAFIASKDSRKGLNDLYTAVNADKVMDESRKNILIGRVQSRMELLDARAERERDRVERQLERDIAGVVSMSEKGYEPTVEQMASLANRARGTSLMPEVQNMVATANFMSKFRQMSPQQQAAVSREWEAVARANPNKQNVEMVGRLRSLQDNMQKQVSDDQVTFAIRQGFVKPDDPAAAPLDMSNPDPQALAARFTLSRQVAGSYQRPTAMPLTSDEVNSLTAFLSNAKAEEKKAYFGMLAERAGADTSGYAALMAQLAPKKPAVAFAGLATARKYATDNGTQVADLILRGDALLNPKEGIDGDGKKMFELPHSGNDKKAMEQLLTDKLGDVAVGRTEYKHNVYQTALNIYAALMEKRKDMVSGVLDADTWKASIDLATGGTVSYKGKTVVSPWGMPLSKFKDGVAERIKAAEAMGLLSEGATADKLLDLPLVNGRADGQYLIRSGDSVLKGKDGKDLVIDFNKAVPIAVPKVASMPKQQRKGSMLNQEVAAGFE